MALQQTVARQKDQISELEAKHLEESKRGDQLLFETKQAKEEAEEHAKATCSFPSCLVLVLLWFPPAHPPPCVWLTRRSSVVVPAWSDPLRPPRARAHTYSAARLQGERRELMARVAELEDSGCGGGGGLADALSRAQAPAVDSEKLVRLPSGFVRWLCIRAA